MKNNSIVGPCDAQKGIGTGQHSIFSILEFVDYKKDKNEKINEEWLASSYDANLAKERQKDFLDKLVALEKYTKQTADNIYHEFFSRRHNHDKIFTALEAKSIGLRIEINDDFPKIINDIIKKNIV